MKIKILAILLFSAVLLFGCVKQNNDLRFYEIVHERGDCKPSCSLEYLVISNGIMLKKESQGVYPNHKIELFSILPEKAGELINLTSANIKESTGEECRNCDLFTLFISTKEKPISFFAKEETAPDFINELEQKTADLEKGGKKEEQFFIQFVFQRLGKDAVDYHFFANGTVLKEEFKGNSFSLENASLYKIPEEKIAQIKSDVKPEFFTSKSSIENCAEKGLSYGYLEVQKGPSYAFSWTCGAENTEADILFNLLLKEYG